MDRQALRDAVVRYNAEWLAGLISDNQPVRRTLRLTLYTGRCDRLTSGRPPALTEPELAPLSARIFRGPDPETDGLSSWTPQDLCRWIEARFDKRLRPQSLSRILRRSRILIVAPHDASRKAGLAALGVSIHAPARGATY